MNDEKEGKLAKETFLKLGWDIYDERDVEVLSEAFKSHGKAMFERGRQNYCDECKEVCENLSDESDRLKERVAELERTRT